MILKFVFPGQHSFDGGLTSCVASSTWVLAELTGLTADSFFALFADDSDSTTTLNYLSDLTKTGTQLHKKLLGYRAPDKSGGERDRLSSWYKRFIKQFLGGELARLISKVKQFAWEDYQAITDLHINKTHVNSHSFLFFSLINLKPASTFLISFFINFGSEESKREAFSN